MQGTEQVWIEEEGGFKVVKIADSLSSSLKHEVCDSFVATVRHLDVTACDIKEWSPYKEGIQAEVKRLNCYSFWIKPFGQENFSKMTRLGAGVNDCLFRRLDRWTESRCNRASFTPSLGSA
eukprot:TRINITY_DN12285_c0_g1_i12.p2 TRINITY_DN12285_c0_g1~~TRINITY_DN12285_c0_g1_i12.p2  ORF type:complete len:121 (-),score=14.80 TRINITY_DN12285_c0_g1_i12:1041-1403(-)